MLQPVLQALVLRLLRRMDEGLHQRGTRGELLRLEIVDLVIAAFPFGLAGETLDPLDEDAAIPAAVEDRDIVLGGQPPQKRQRK